MGLLATALAPWLGAARQSYWLSQGGDALARLLGGSGASASGITVTEATAMNLSAVWCAVQNIAGTIGSLPLMLYRRVDDEGRYDPDYRSKMIGHSLYPLLHDKPNPDMTASLFWETLVQHALLWGNGYGYIQRDQAGRVAAIWLLTPDRVRIVRDPQNRDASLYYEASNSKGQKARLEPAEVVHVPNLTYDGVCGYSVISRARESLGLTSAAERFGSQFFGQGANASMVVTHPSSLSEAAHKRITDSITETVSGDKALRVLVLEEGITVEKMTIPPDDAQFLETRKFQIIEICRWFNIPPHKLKDLERATFSNIEEQGIDYYRDTIRPWLVRIEREVNTKLIAPLERRQQFAEFIVDALLRSNTPAQDESFKAGRQWGWYSVNEIRRMKNMNPIPDGNQYLVPQNMAPADRIDDIIDGQTAPDPAPAPAPAPPAPADDGRGAIITALVTEIRDAVDPMLQAIADAVAMTVPRAVPEPVADDPPAPLVDEAAPRRRAQEITAQRAIIEDVVRRMLAREKGKAREAAKSAERLRAWIGGDWYPKHGEGYCANLVQPIRLHLARIGSDRDPDSLTRELVTGYIEESRRQLHGLLDRQPADVAAELNELLARWDIERVQGIPDAVMTEELAHGEHIGRLRDCLQ